MSFNLFPELNNERKLTIFKQMLDKCLIKKYSLTEKEWLFVKSLKQSYDTERTFIPSNKQFMWLKYIYESD